jgi:hypothetical protein
VIQLERLVVEGIRAKVQPDGSPKVDVSDRGVTERHVRRIVVGPNSIDIELRDPTPALALSLVTEAPVTAGATASPTCTTVISLPWSARSIASVKGVVHQTEGCQADPQTRDPGRYP